MRRAGGRHKEVRTFGATTVRLLALAERLESLGVTHVAMEATGVYWKPVYYLLEERFACHLVNARHVVGVPGHKTDVWTPSGSVTCWPRGCCPAQLRAAHTGPPVARRVPLPARAGPRTHPRGRAGWTSSAQTAGIKLSTVASDTLGVSARAMLEALVAGQRDLEMLSQLTKGRLRKKLTGTA